MSYAVTSDLRQKVERPQRFLCMFEWKHHVTKLFLRCENCADDERHHRVRSHENDNGWDSPFKFFNVNHRLIYRCYIGLTCDLWPVTRDPWPGASHLWAESNKSLFLTCDPWVTRDPWPGASHLWVEGNKSLSSDLWPVTCDPWPVTHDLWHLTCE